MPTNNSSQETNICIDNTPIPCGGEFISTQCVINPNALVELGLPKNSTVEQIIAAIQNALINLSTDTGTTPGTANNTIEVQKDSSVIANNATRLNFIGNLRAEPDLVDTNKINISTDDIEYTLNLDAANTLSILENSVVTGSVDLSALLDNINLSRVVSANVTGTDLIFVRDDATEFSVDLSSLIQEASDILVTFNPTAYTPADASVESHIEAIHDLITGQTNIGRICFSEGTGSGLTGLQNGTNTTFTISQGNYEATILVFLNGKQLFHNNGIVLTSPTTGVFDFANAPSATDQIFVYYYNELGEQDEFITFTEGTGNGLLGTQNGTNTTFTTSRQEYQDDILVFLNGKLQHIGNGLVKTSPTTGVFDFESAPSATDHINVYYKTSEIIPEGGPRFQVVINSIGGGLAGSVNGTNTAFTVSEAEYQDDILVFLNGKLLSEGDGITLTNSTTGVFDFEDAPVSGDNIFVYYRAERLASFLTGGSGISNVVEDITPQLGGDLSLNGNDILSNGDFALIDTTDGTGVLVNSGLDEVKIQTNSSGAGINVRPDTVEFFNLGLSDIDNGSPQGAITREFLEREISNIPSGTSISRLAELRQPIAQNTIPNLTQIPSNLTTIQTLVNGSIVDNLIGSGISVDSSGIVTVNSSELGYNIEITDRVVIYYTV